jgi:hypothetical protein
VNYDNELLVVIEVNMNNLSFTQNELVQEYGDPIHFGNPLDSWGKEVHPHFLVYLFIV